MTRWLSYDLLDIANHSYLSVFIYSVENFFGHKLLEVRYCRLRTDPDEAALQLRNIATITLETHIQLFILPMVVALDVGLI